MRAGGVDCEHFLGGGLRVETGRLSGGGGRVIWDCWRGMERDEMRSLSIAFGSERVVGRALGLLFQLCNSG